MLAVAESNWVAQIRSLVSLQADQARLTAAFVIHFCPA